MARYKAKKGRTGIKRRTSFLSEDKNITLEMEAQL